MRCEKSVLVACQPDVLWPWLVEPERCKRWMKGLLEVRSLDGGPPRAGARYELVIREGGKPATYRETMVEHVPGRRLVLELVGGCFGETPMRVEYDLEPADGGTLLVCRSSADLSGWMRLLTPLLALFGGLQLSGFLKRLKELAESPAGAVAS